MARHAKFESWGSFVDGQVAVLQVVAVMALASCTAPAPRSSEINWCGQAFDRLAALPSLQGVVSFPSEGSGFVAYSTQYRLLAGAPGAPNGLTSKLVALAELADRLQAEVEMGRSAETIINGSTFDVFFTAGSSFAKAFDQACPGPPLSVDTAGASTSLPSHIGFTPVAAPVT